MRRWELRCPWLVEVALPEWDHAAWLDCDQAAVALDPELHTRDRRLHGHQVDARRIRHHGVNVFAVAGFRRSNQLAIDGRNRANSRFEYPCLDNIKLLLVNLVVALSDLDPQLSVGRAKHQPKA
ncbi:hypothetical protein D3C72_1480770 [compost metagenome]